MNVSMNVAWPRLAACCAFLSLACGTAPGDDPIEDDRPLPSLELLTTIGCGDCEGLAQITPTGVEVDVEGRRVLVFDRHEPVVRAFGYDGEPLGSFGELGHGPGEIQFSFGTFGFVRPGGQVLVYDLVGVHEFGRDGEFITLHRWPPRLPLSVYYAPAADRIYVLGMDPPTPGAQRPAEASILAFDPDDPDFAAQLLLAEGDMPRDEEDVDRRVVQTIAVDGKGQLLLGDRRNYRLFRYSAGTGATRTFGRELPPPILGSAERARLVARMRQLGSDREVAETTDHFADQGLRFDSRGRLWVETLRWDGVADERVATTFDIFAESDLFLGEVTVGERLGGGGFPVVALRDDLLAGAHLGEDGEWRVSLWRIVG